MFFLRNHHAELEVVASRVPALVDRDEFHAPGLNVLDELLSAGSLGEWQFTGDPVIPILVNDIFDERVGDGPGAERILLNVDGHAAGVVLAGSPVEGRMGTKKFLMESSAGLRPIAKKSSSRPTTNEILAR